MNKKNNNNELFTLVSDLMDKLWGPNSQFDNSKTAKKICAQLYSPDRDERSEGESTINMWLQAGCGSRISSIWCEVCYPFPNDIGGGRTDETEAAADATTEPLRAMVEAISVLSRELAKGA